MASAATECVKLGADAESALHAVAVNWEDVIDAKQMEVTRLTGAAVTNHIFQCSWQTRDGEKPRKVLVRIYGEAVNTYFDREYEIRAFECISKVGQGPRLLGYFQNGRIEEFLNAKTLSAPDIRNPEISAKIAAKLWEFHQIEVPGSRQPMLWTRLREWVKTALALCPKNVAAEFQLDCMEEDINYLEKMIWREDQKVAFCHNDLQYGNIMMNDEDKTLTIIDYDCSTYNPVAYDIANHFCEMAGDYHSDTPHILDFSKYPDLEKRRTFVKEYLKQSTGETVSEKEVEQVLKDIEKYTIASHIHWALWGIIAGRVNTIDFDYMEYARQRFQQYNLWRHSILNIE